MALLPSCFAINILATDHVIHDDVIKVRTETKIGNRSLCLREDETMSRMQRAAMKKTKGITRMSMFIWKSGRCDGKLGALE
jgi:hypothetical protein